MNSIFSFIFINLFIFVSSSGAQIPYNDYSREIPIFRKAIEIIASDITSKNPTQFSKKCETEFFFEKDKEGGFLICWNVKNGLSKKNRNKLSHVEHSGDFTYNLDHSESFFLSIFIHYRFGKVARTNEITFDPVDPFLECGYYLVTRHQDDKLERSIIGSIESGLHKHISPLSEPLKVFHSILNLQRNRIAPLERYQWGT
ncbi:MAG: hypothetical protein HC904_08190 [Blastochloris sp.]|nr:hypothetical protein [Blastochloris sp.]